MAKRQRTLRTGSALALSAIQQYCPAVFATEPHESRGPKYEYLPTIEPLTKLLENGWGVYEATQNQTRDPSKESFTRHSLRLRRLEDVGRTNRYGGAADGVGELVLTNAHDGTAAYSLTAGFYRLVCSNGLTVGKQVAAHRVIHSKGRATGLIIDAATRVIEDDFPKMLTQIDLFKSSEITREQSYHLAEVAMQLRYGDTLKPFPTDDLLKVRRPVDDGLSAWSVLNRIQENVMQGGWETRSIFSGRRSAVRPVEAIVPTQRINAGLWTACEELLA